MYVRVVSMPCCELFDMKPLEYQMEILPEGTAPYLLSTVLTLCPFLETVNHHVDHFKFSRVETIEYCLNYDP